MAEVFTSVPAKSTLKFLWFSARNPPAEPTASFDGKVILITGANAGLGFQAAKKLVALGPAKLIFAVRSLQRGQDAKAKIEAETSCRKDLIEVFLLDMGSLTCIDEFVTHLNEKVPTVHIAILNAGTNLPRYETSSDDWEMCLQVNTISTAYLAILLLPKLRETAKRSGLPSVLEIVASVGHSDVDISNVTDPKSILQKVNDQANYNMFKQYSITKLLAMWAMKRIANKVNPNHVIVLASCPGLCRSDMGRNFNVAMNVADSIAKTFIGRTAKEGGRGLVNATIVGTEAHGGFFSLDVISQ